MKSIGKNAVFNVIYRGLNIVFPLVISVYVARILNADGIGSVASVQNIVTYFTYIACLGIPAYGTKVIAGYMNNRKEMSRTFSELLCINIISAVIASSLYGILIAVVPFFREKILLYLIIGLLIPFSAVNVEWFYQGIEEYGYIMKRSFVVKILCLVLTFLWVKDKGDLAWYALTITLATTLNYLFNVIHIRKYIAFSLKDLCMKKHLKSILILFAASIATEVYVLGDTTMLTVIHGDTAVGYYYTSMRIIAIIRTLVVSVAAVWYPRLSYYYLNGFQEKFKSFTDKGINLLLLCTIPSCLGIMLLAEDIIPVVLGKGFAASIVSTRILAVSIITVALSNFIGSQLFVVIGKEKMTFFSTVAGAVVNICLNLLLIFRFGHYGVAVASAFTEFCVTAFQWYVLTRKTGMKIKLYDLKSIVAASLVMAGVVSGIKIFFTGNEAVRLFSGVCLGAVSFFITAFFMRNSILCEGVDWLKKKRKKA